MPFDRYDAEELLENLGITPEKIMEEAKRYTNQNGSLTGYGGGIQNKVSLLKLEGTNMKKFFVPKKGTAL